MAEFFAELSKSSDLILTALGQHVLISLVAIILGAAVICKCAWKKTELHTCSFTE